ncbi:hypothetical protein GCM10028787_30970 [Brachybacterium horti]
MAAYADWLGQVLDKLTESQRAQFTLAADAYYEQPHIVSRDDMDTAANQADDDAALGAILQHIRREGSLASAAADARDADHVLTGWVRGMAALGMSETRISEETRLARATVRRRLGKR